MFRSLLFLLVLPLLAEEPKPAPKLPDAALLNWVRARAEWAEALLGCDPCQAALRHQGEALMEAQKTCPVQKLPNGDLQCVPPAPDPNPKTP